MRPTTHLRSTWAPPNAPAVDYENARCKFSFEGGAYLDIIRNNSIEADGASLFCLTPRAPVSEKIVTQVSVALNGVDFVTALDLSSSQYSYYPQTLESIEPVGGSFTQSTSVTVRGFFFPGFDGLSGSARCKFGEALSTPTLLEAKNGLIVCDSPPRPDSLARTDVGGAGFEDVEFSVALNTVDFVGSANVSFRYYDHLLASISPQGGHLQGDTSVVIYGDRFDLLLQRSLLSSSFVRCRFGEHEPVAGTIAEANGQVFIRCKSSNSEAYGRTSTGYEYVSAAINGQNFLPTLDGEDGCYLNPDACAKFKYYTENVFSLWPVAGPAHGTTDVTISGEFSPGYDGVPTSARCLYQGVGTSTVQRLEPTSVRCPAIAADVGVNATQQASQVGVALNGAYVADDSPDYVSIRSVCPTGSVGNYQQFVQYEQEVFSISPTGGPRSGNTVVTVVGRGFAPITTPSSTPALLQSSVRCLWDCTPLDAHPDVCSERGDGAAALLTRPTHVSDDMIVCATPPRLAAGLDSLGLALNVYDATEATCSDGLRNGGETGVDCGSSQCGACAPTCFDGIQNGGETGVDCGGLCPYCVPECAAPNDVNQDCQFPTLSGVHPSSGPTGQATLLTIHGQGFHQAGEIISYQKQVLGQETTFVHNSLPRCSFGHGSSRQEMPASVVDSTEVRCRAPPAALVGCYRLLVSFDVCDFHAAIEATCASERKEGLPFSYVASRQYPGHTPAGATYAYPGDFVDSKLKFRFYDHPPPTFTVLGLGTAAHGASPTEIASHRQLTERRALADGTQLAANRDGISVAAGGPIAGGTLLSVTFAHAGAPFFALDEREPIAIEQSRCAFGEPAYTQPLNVSAGVIECPAPPKPAVAVVPLRVSLNGVQFFDTGLDFEYYEHPTISSISPRGGVDTGATPVTVSGRGFRNFQPLQPVQLCSWGTGPGGERQTTRAKVLSATRMECPSSLRGEAADVPFSVSLNGLDFVSDSAQVYRFYDQPPTFLGVHPTGGPLEGGTLMTLSGSGFANFDGDASTARCVWGAANVHAEHRATTTPTVLEDDQIVCRSTQVGAISPYFYSSVKIALNGIEYGVSQYVRFYDQPSLFLDLQPITGGPIAGGSVRASCSESGRHTTPHHTTRRPCAPPIHPPAFHLNAPRAEPGLARAPCRSSLWAATASVHE